MLNITLISTIIGIFIGFGTLIAGIGFAYAQFKSGGSKAKDDLIDTLKETALVEQEKADRLEKEKAILVGSHQAQLNELNNKIGKLQGLYEAAEKNRAEYLSILQGRDPGQQEFMKFMMEAAKNTNRLTSDANRYMADTIEILGEIKIFMQNFNNSPREPLDITTTTTLKRVKTPRNKKKITQVVA